MHTEWQEIKTNPEYIVSNTGRVRRIGSDRDKLPKSSKRYVQVDLYADGKRTCKSVHHLVAEAFIPNPDNRTEVNHKDGDKHNNHVDNLEWVTHKENCQHAWKNGLAKPSRGMLGKKNPNGGRKGKPIRIVETGEVFNSSLECEKAIGGNNRHINDCLQGRQNTHRGYHFEYV